jgi:hypothetical protein
MQKQMIQQYDDYRIVVVDKLYARRIEHHTANTRLRSQNPLPVNGGVI